MVDQVSDAPRTRRAVLTAAAAAGAATVASAIARPLPVAAAGNDGQNIVVGGFYPDARSQLTVANSANDEIVMWVASNSDGGHGLGTAIVGYSAKGRGVHGLSQEGGIGVYAESVGGWGLRAVSTGAFGVYASSNNAAGVRAQSTSGYGVHATSDSNNAVRAESNSSIAVVAQSTSHFAVHATSQQAIGIVATSNGETGLLVDSSGAGKAATVSLAKAGGTGVHGHAGTTPPNASANTGVFGTAEGSGTGGFFSSPTGNALRVVGKASFTRAGRVSVPRNSAYVDITVAGGLASTAAVVATLQTPRGTCAVTSVRVNYPSAGKARIYLNKVASTTATTPVGYFVIG